MAALDPNLIPLGLPWIGKEDYATVVAIFEDPDDWPDMWETFAARIESAERGLQEVGKITARVNIDTLHFPRWCAIHNVRHDTKSAYKFAADIAIKGQRNTGGLW